MRGLLTTLARRSLLVAGLAAAYAGYRRRQRGPQPAAASTVITSVPTPAGRPPAATPTAAISPAPVPTPAPWVPTPVAPAPAAPAPASPAPTPVASAPAAPGLTVPTPFASAPAAPIPAAPAPTAPIPAASAPAAPAPAAPIRAAPVAPDPVATPVLASAPARPARTVLAASLRSVDPGRPASVAFTIAGIALGVAGYFHGHLYHEGYRAVAVVGPLFFLNVVGTAVVLLLLIAGRMLAFVGGALSIGLGAIVSILISHGSSFFGFAESGYQTTAVIILVAEVLAVVLTLVGLVLGRRRLLVGLPGGSSAA